MATERPIGFDVITSDPGRSSPVDYDVTFSPAAPQDKQTELEQVELLSSDAEKKKEVGKTSPTLSDAEKVHTVQLFLLFKGLDLANGVSSHP